MVGKLTPGLAAIATIAAPANLVDFRVALSRFLHWDGMGIGKRVRRRVGKEGGEVGRALCDGISISLHLFY